MNSTAELLIGAHVSAAGGAYRALAAGMQIGATTLQLFTANQKRWDSKPLAAKDVALWHETQANSCISHVMSHASYLINLASPNSEMLIKSCRAFQAEIARCHALDIAYLNFHPGSALQQKPQQGLDRIVESLLECEELLQQGKTRLLLETTAGQGSVLGWRFEELAYVILRVEARIPIGVCIDTCHIFSAGYDIRSRQGWDKTLQEFDQQIGLKHLFAFHVNDSAKPFASRLDRHKPLGEGTIGIDSFQFLMQDGRTCHLPKYLETPGELDLWKKEINMLRNFASSK